MDSIRSRLFSSAFGATGAISHTVLGTVNRRQFVKLAGLAVGSTVFWRLIPMNEEAGAMLSEIPIMHEKIGKQDLDREILRTAIIAEYDAINLYEQMAAATENGNVKKVLLDIAREEKTHVGEFQALLLRTDQEHKKQLQEGKEEVQELLGE